MELCQRAEEKSPPGGYISTRAHLVFQVDWKVWGEQGAFRDGVFFHRMRLEVTETEKPGVRTKVRTRLWAEGVSTKLNGLKVEAQRSQSGLGGTGLTPPIFDSSAGTKRW